MLIDILCDVVLYYFIPVKFMKPLCIDSIAYMHVLLVHVFKIKHFWPYTKYNNICLSYKKPGWPKLSSSL